MKKVLITGSKGIIGKPLSRELSKDYELTLADIPEIDVRDYNQVLRVATNQDAIIHLAWNSREENFQNNKTHPDNKIMYQNIYKVALENKIPRVIMASSVHADNHMEIIEKNSEGIIKPLLKNIPDSPYGKTKIEMEKEGLKYSKKGLEVVCIRIGAIAKEPQIKNKVLTSTWLSFPDFYSLVKMILNAKKIPNNFFIVYGISNNKTRIHSYENPLGWRPKDDSSRFTEN